MSKISTTAADLLGRLAGKRAQIAADQEEVAELERAAAWAAGQERRDRLTAIAADAQQLATASDQTGATLRTLTHELAVAARRVQEAGAAHNAALAEVVGRLRTENVPPHGTTPYPSPANAMVGPATGGGVAVRRHRIRPVNIGQILARAVDAAQRDDDLSPESFANVAIISEEVPDYAANIRFYRHPEHGGVSTFDHEPPAYTGLVPIGRREFLARTWGVDLDTLPEDVFPPSGEPPTAA